MSGPADIPIGERVRFYRQSRQKTQAVVAGLAGVTEDYLSQIERGLKTPSTALLHRLARVLGVPTSVLFGESAAEPATPGHPLSAAIHAALASGGDGRTHQTRFNRDHHRMPRQRAPEDHQHWGRGLCRHR